MSLPHMSVATIKSPEFINLQPLEISPFMSKCEIKVFYLGENRNGTFINEDTAREMAKTLRGCPIVGSYRDEKEDFTDHGEQVIFDSEGITFNCLTKPYGFVSPDADVWFQEFEDEDEFGNKTTRKYMMTTGYLWTEQYPEAKQVFADGGKPHSMELDNETLQGHWAENPAKGLDFFIITDAIFSKLCILGDDVEPCFEGSSVTAPTMSKFSLDADFKNTLFNMMKQLQYALKGEDNMDKENFNPEVSEEVVATPEQEFAKKDEDEDKKKGCHTAEDAYENAEGGDDAAAEDDAPAAEPEGEAEGAEEPNEDGEADPEPEKEEEGEPESEFTISKEQYEELQGKYEQLEKINAELLAFKETIENEKKDALIAEFYMLSDEDKKDVVENKTSYSLDEIKAKLAVIAYDRKVSFEQESDQNFDNNMENVNLVLSNYSVNDHDVSTPDWVKAVEDTANNM